MERIKFNEKELEPVGQYFSIPGPGFLAKYDMPITPRENFLLALNHEKPLWIPNYYDITSFCPACYPDSIARGFVMSAELADYMEDDKKGGKDSFGINWVFEPIANGSMVLPGNPLLKDMNEWKDYVQIPEVDSWDWGKSKKANEEYIKNNDGILIGWIFTSFFERLISLLDFENAAMAMIDEEQEEAVHEFFESCVQVYKKVIKHYREDFGVDVIYMHDDWGTQRAPFFSLDTCMEKIVPHFKEVVDYAHSLGMKFELHSCGKIEPMVPAMIAIGVDMWAGQTLNDVDKLRDMYGDKLLFGVYENADPDEADEKAYEKGKKFAEKYAADYEKRPVYHCELFDLNPKYREAVYVESRKILNN